LWIAVTPRSAAGAQRAKVEILKHLDGDLVIVRPSSPGERRAEISGRAKADSLLRDQAAVAYRWLRGPATTEIASPRPSTDGNGWEFTGNRCGNTVGIWELDRGSLRPLAFGRAPGSITAT